MKTKCFFAVSILSIVGALACFAIPDDSDSEIDCPAGHHSCEDGDDNPQMTCYTRGYAAGGAKKGGVTSGSKTCDYFVWGPDVKCKPRSGDCQAIGGVPVRKPSE